MFLSPFLEEATAQEIAGWVRLILTGDAASATPTEEAIDRLLGSTVSQLVLRFPTCLAGAPDALDGTPSAVTGSSDWDAFNESAGYLLASKIVTMPGGQSFAQYVMSVKQGTVTQTLSGAELVGGASESLLASSSAALTRIECVRDVLAAKPRANLLSLSGRRRSLGCGY